MCPDEVFHTFPQAVEGSPTGAQSSVTDSRPNRSKPVCRKAVLTACEEMKSPVILGVSEGAGKYMTGFKTVAAMVSSMVETMGITVPVALHLDHGTYEGCKACVEAGFSSIMFDGSHYSIEENVEKTKELVALAHAKGLSIEAEVGSIGGVEDGVVGAGEIADPAQDEGHAPSVPPGQKERPDVVPRMPRFLRRTAGLHLELRAAQSDFDRQQHRLVLGADHRLRGGRGRPVRHLLHAQAVVERPRGRRRFRSLPLGSAGQGRSPRGSRTCTAETR